MKALFRFLRRFLPHSTLILSLMMITFFVIDRFNESMAFLNSSITKWLSLFFALLSAILSVLTILQDESKH